MTRNNRTMNHIIKKLLLIALLTVAITLSGCAESQIYDGETIDEYNDHINTWNEDIITYNANMDRLSTAIDKYNMEIEEYNSKLWASDRDYIAAENKMADAKSAFTYNAMIIKGHLNIYNTFLIENRDILERNDINVQKQLTKTSDWKAEIDYNIQYAAEW